MGLDMVKKQTKQTRSKAKTKGVSSRTRALVLPILGIIAIGAVVLAVLSVIMVPKVEPGRQYGVGAGGFRAYEERDTTLGIDKVVSKDQVVDTLGKKAKSVDDMQVSNVFNLNDNRGQTLTYDFVRSDGVKSSLYVDVMLFKNTNALNEANIYTATAKAGAVNGHPARYMHAQTLGSEREYRLMVVNGLKVYKFVIVQPLQSITISEVAAVAALKTLANKAKL